MRIFKRTAFIRTLFFILADAILIVSSVWLAFLMRFDANIPQSYLKSILIMAGFLIVFAIPAFYFLRLYSFSWSYVSAGEAIALFKSITISFIFLGIAAYALDFFPKFINFPRSTIFISYFLIFILTGALRFSKRIYLYLKGRGRMADKDKEKTLIVGAGDAGEQILRNIISSRSNNYFPVGFLDDNPIKQKVAIHGLRVLGKISDIKIISKEKDIKQVIIALPTAGNKTIRNVVDLARQAGIRKIKIVPKINEIVDGKVSLKNLKDVGAEDLLGRDAVILDKKEIENFIKNKKILITGGAGSIGSELCRQTARFKPSLLLVLDQDETGIFNIENELKKDYPQLKIKTFVADVADREKIEKVIMSSHPQIIFHAAAYKHVPLMEENPDEAVKNNVFGTENMVKICSENNVEKFIFISTDKAVNPTSIMGTTKRIGEKICQAYNKKGNTKFVSVRFGNVLDSRGSVIPIFREQIKRGGPVEVTHPEIKRYFMLNSEACLLVMQAGAMGQGGEVFVLDMGEPIKILDLAKDMIRLSGLEPDKDIAIVFIGLRPGEKMFEEILTAEEGTIATKNQKIFKAKLSETDFDDLEVKLKKLKEKIESSDKKEIALALKDIVMLYKPDFL